MSILHSAYFRRLYLYPILLIIGYMLPPLLIFLGWIDYEYRYHIMAPVIIAAIIYAIFRKFNKEELGMTSRNFFPALSWQIGITVTCTLIAVLAMKAGYIRTLDDIPQSIWFFVMYLFISGPVQEFVYRAVPFAEINRRNVDINKWLIILLVSFNFAWLHIIYLDWIIFFASFFMGLLWTSIYYHKPNYWAVSIAHAICGFLAIWYGLV